MSVRVATTTNLAALSGLLTVDGITVVAGDLVLVKNQTTGTQNGVYVADSSAWSRSAILAVGVSAVGVVYYVISGSINGKESFVCTSNPAVVGTDSLVFGLYNTSLKFFWASGAYGNPSTGQLINATFTGTPAASYSGVLDGVTLTTATNNQNGQVNWNVTGFDFTRDFQLSVCFFQGSGADGVSFGVGGSSTFSGNTGTVNGGLCAQYNTFTNNDQFSINGAAVGNLVGFHSGITYTNVWMTSRLIVRTFGTKRYAMLLTGNDNPMDNSYEVTSWTPGGTWIFVGGRTGAANAAHYCNAVYLSYLP